MSTTKTDRPEDTTVETTNEAQRELARNLYMSYQSRDEIVEKSGMSMSSLKYYIHKSWYKEREASKYQMVQALSDSKKKVLTSIVSDGLELVARSMKEWVRSGKVLTPKEADSISKIITDADKISKLDEGSPTDILGEIKPATYVEIREARERALELDPFHIASEIEEGEFKELSEPTPENKEE